MSHSKAAAASRPTVDKVSMAPCLSSSECRATGYYSEAIAELFAEDAGVSLDCHYLSFADISLMECLLACDEHAPPAALWLIARFGDDRAAEYVAGNAAAPRAVLDILAQRECPSVRRALLQNKKITGKQRGRLMASVFAKTH